MELLTKGRVLHDRYRIVREINRGATAVVYEADDLNSTARIALKVMNVMTGQQGVPLKMVKREVEYASTTRHPNIVRLFDVFAEGNHLVLAWELIEGQDLLDLLNHVGGHMDEDMAAFFMQQILRGVAFMHENDFCHRDLKPENCMVETKTYNLKIIDFGLSKHLDSVNTLGIGTPDYMAPEMLGTTTMSSNKGGPRYDAKAVDVWSLGVTLYLLVTGVYPFENPRHPNSVSHTLNNIRVNAVRPFPVELSQECRTLIRSLLNPSPKDRPKLKEIEGNKWIVKNAKAYTSKIKRAEIMVAASHEKGSPRIKEDGNGTTAGCWGIKGMVSGLGTFFNRIFGRS